MNKTVNKKVKINEPIVKPTSPHTQIDTNVDTIKPNLNVTKPSSQNLKPQSNPNEERPKTKPDEYTNFLEKKNTSHYQPQVQPQVKYDLNQVSVKSVPKKPVPEGIFQTFLFYFKLANFSLSN
jgi:hypothetical protein